MSLWTQTKTRLIDHTDRPPQDKLFERALARLATEQLVGFEGGAGCGKSLIIAPLLLRNLITDHPGRVIIAANTKAQQDTIELETTPRVADLLPRGAVVLKGRDNYICLRRAGLAGFSLAIEGDGTRPNYPAVSDADWPLICSSSDAGCSRDCHGDAYQRTRAAAKDCSLLITNHRILALDYTLDGLILSNEIGPKADLLVVDEAHLFADVLSESLGGSVTPRMLSLAAKAVRSANAATGSRIDDRLLERAAEQLRFALDYLGPDRSWDAFDTGLEILKAVKDTIAEVEELGVRVPPEVRGLSSRLTRLSHPVHLLAHDFRSTHAIWTVKSRSGLMGVEARQFDVARNFVNLADRFGKTLAMSATMEPLTDRRLGLDEITRTDPPFDVRSNRLAYVTPAKVEGSPHQWDAAELVSLVTLTEGRALVVASSKTEARRAAAALEAAGFTVGLQGEGGSAGVPKLIEQLKLGKIGAIVGVDSVGTGIDIPGDALRLVAILDPFNPNVFADKFLSLWQDLFATSRQAWEEVFAPMAAEQMEQTVGRLLRTPSDSGVVAFLDPRSRQKQKFRGAVAPSIVTTDLGSVEAWLREHRS